MKKPLWYPLLQVFFPMLVPEVVGQAALKNEEGDQTEGWAAKPG